MESHFLMLFSAVLSPDCPKGLPLCAFTWLFPGSFCFFRIPGRLFHLLYPKKEASVRLVHAGPLIMPFKGPDLQDFTACMDPDTAAAHALLQRQRDRLRLVRPGIDVAFAVMDRHTCLRKKTQQVIHGKTLQCRPDQIPGSISAACMIAAAVHGQIGQVAAAVSGRIDLLSDFFVFFIEVHQASLPRGRDGGHASGCSGTDHGDPPLRRCGTLIRHIGHITFQALPACALHSLGMPIDIRIASCFSSILAASSAVS